MMKKILKYLGRTGAARRAPQGLARDLLKLQLGGPPGAGDQALGTLLLRDSKPRQRDRR